MRSIGKLLFVASVSAALAVAPIGFGPTNPLDFMTSTAFAKSGGNGGGNGNGGGGGGNSRGGSGQGKGGSASAGKGKSTAGSSQAKGQAKQSTDPVSRAIGKLFDKQKRTTKPAVATKAVKKSTAAMKTEVVAAKPLATKEKPTLAAKLAGLNSLNRNYHAYLNSKDPRMVAISAYVTAYAQYEMENGTDTIPTDPALSDDALRAALLSAANKNRVEQYGDDTVDQDVMDWAKDVLGVGPAVGKIDQIRDSLSSEEAQVEGEVAEQSSAALQ